jgi:hypothetical protein
MNGAVAFAAPRMYPLPIYSFDFPSGEDGCNKHEYFSFGEVPSWVIFSAGVHKGEFTESNGAAYPYTWWGHLRTGALNPYLP